MNSYESVCRYLASYGGKMRLPAVFILIAMAVPAAAFSASSRTLTMKDAIRMAVEKNLDVRAELYNAAQYEADINRYRAIYDPSLTLLSSYTDSDSAPASSSGQSMLLNSSLSQLLWSGGTASLSFNNAYAKNSTSTPATSWQTRVGMSLTQPLLKNAGRDVTESNINISRLSKFASLERFNLRLLSTVAQVRNEYYKLHSLREELKVKQISLELSRKILNETKARVEAGVLPAMEILNAEFGAVTREKELIVAEQGVRDQVDILRLLLQMDNDGADLITVDTPSLDKFEPDENDAIKKALDRPDIREQKRNLENSELQTKVLNQKILPDLSFNASAYLTGYDSEYQRNLDKLRTTDYPVWSVGLTLSYPIGNGAAENDYRKSRLKTEQAALMLRSIEESSANDVKSAIRGVVAGYKQIEVADRGKAFAEERLKAFIKKNEVGLATTRDVLDVENDLATAKSNQIKAVVGYANSLTRFWQVTGELLEREGVRVVEADADKLYKSAR